MACTPPPADYGCRAYIAPSSRVTHRPAPTVAPQFVRASGGAMVTESRSTYAANGTPVTGEIPVGFADVFPPRDVRRGCLRSTSRAQLEVFLDEHRAALNGCFDGLTEEQARRSLVSSRTTLLGLGSSSGGTTRVSMSARPNISRRSRSPDGTRKPAIQDWRTPVPCRVRHGTTPPWRRRPSCGLRRMTPDAPALTPRHSSSGGLPRP